MSIILHQAGRINKVIDSFCPRIFVGLIDFLQFKALRCLGHFTAGTVKDLSNSIILLIL